MKTGGSIVTGFSYKILIWKTHDTLKKQNNKNSHDVLNVKLHKWTHIFTDRGNFCPKNVFIKQKTS